jgi:hypothetical protein
MADQDPRFDPLGMIAALDHQRVSYVVIGGFARVIQGADETTRGVDIVPSLRPENLRRLALALDELEAQPADANDRLATEPSETPYTLRTRLGELKVVTAPAGTSGYDDLRRAATREPLGSVAAHGGTSPALAQLRRLAELERQRGIDR